MADDVVPFGKYKGRPVDEMLADTGYMEWLGAQPWFRERFGHLIDAYDRAEAEATPIHNRLQALFLDPVYQAAFATCVIGAAISSAVAKEMTGRDNAASTLSSRVAALRSEDERRDPDAFVSSYAAQQRTQGIAKGEAVLRQLTALDSPSVKITAAFEAPQDVVLSLVITEASLSWSGYGERLENVALYVTERDSRSRWTLRTEIKPAIGDDYPVVLRQMMRNGSQYLYVGRYEGVGATEDQFVAIFKASGKTVVFKADVDAEAARLRDAQPE